MDDQVRAQIERAISDNEVIVFMKGTQQAPSCGFSARTVELLDSVLGSYASVDVLSHPEVREGIKEYSSWPTIPQVYVHGKFLGGADLVAEMYESGELHAALGITKGSVKAPQITLTDAARDAFLGYLEGTEEVVLLDVDRAFSPNLSVGPMPERAVIVETNGVTLAMNRLSAARAEGITIDFVTTPDGQAFKVDNPNEPGKVKALSVHDYKKMQDERAPHRLIDVRTGSEWQTARIEGAELLDTELLQDLEDLPKDTVLVFQCHHGHRSQRAAEQFIPKGFKTVYNLTGGIDAWSREIDSNVPTY